MDRISAASPDQRAQGALLFTTAELASHRRELERLLQIRNQYLPRLLRDARTFVSSDAAEERVQIQVDHAVVEARISRLEHLLHDARVLADDIEPGVVSVGRVVQVEYLRTNAIVTYLVTATAMTAGRGTLSSGSPVGRALMGHAAGDTVVAALPTGHVEDLRILSVRSVEEASGR
jgi:transcription elongation factor GreA